MIGLVVALIVGYLVVDVALDLWCHFEGVERQRQRERDRAEMLRSLDRHPRL